MSAGSLKAIKTGLDVAKSVTTPLRHGVARSFTQLGRGEFGKLATSLKEGGANLAQRVRQMDGPHRGDLKKFASKLKANTQGPVFRAGLEVVEQGAKLSTNRQA